MEPISAECIWRKLLKLPIKSFQRIGVMSAFFMAAWLFVAPQWLWANAPPQLVFESTERLQPLVHRLKRVNPKQFLATMDLVGLQHPGPPIRVILAADESDLAQKVPPWIVGYAMGQASTIVLLPDRVGNYPYDSLEEVLLHELGHILTHRAADGRPVPRWFDEGLAMIAARTWNIEERARLIWAMVSGRQVSFDELNAWFVTDGPSARRAYVIAHALTLDLIEQSSPDFPKRLLATVAAGTPFRDAFAQTAYLPLEQAEAKFWNHQTVWNRWIPVATSTGMVWLMITALVFYAARKQRKRAAVIQRRWEDEDLSS